MVLEEDWGVSVVLVRDWGGSLLFWRGFRGVCGSGGGLGGVSGVQEGLTDVQGGGRTSWGPHKGHTGKPWGWGEREFAWGGARDPG